MIYLLQMKYLIFDYNGTIIDDVGLSLEALNFLVRRYLDREEVGKEEYIRSFCFPVINYYRAIGFDFAAHSFEEIGKEWNQYYRSHFSRDLLKRDVLAFMDEARDKGYKLVVLSAANQEDLIREMRILGIEEYFEELLGADNIYGRSKIDRGLAFKEAHPDDDCLLIGDTLHDFETARAMGIDCVLVEGGHQILDLADCRVVKEIGEIEL